MKKGTRAEWQIKTWIEEYKRQGKNSSKRRRSRAGLDPQLERPFQPASVQVIDRDAAADNQELANATLVKAILALDSKKVQRDRLEDEISELEQVTIPRLKETCAKMNEAED